MPKELAILELRNRQQWRTWLNEHHSISPGIWLVFYKSRTRVESIAYEDSVREALCFGWIDSLVKRLDDDRYARKFTPRKATSKWSEINRNRWMELEAAGLLTAAGAAAAPTANTYAPRTEVASLPDWIAEGLRKSPAAWHHFQQMAPGHQRQYVIWMCSAKRPETQKKHILESIARLENGQKLGLK